jgi:hypothetical protein
MMDGMIVSSNVIGDIDDMTSPVRCGRCNAIYDLGKVKVIHRYADCTLFTTPCCNQNVDERTWVCNPAVIQLSGRELANLRCYHRP